MEAPLSGDTEEYRGELIGQRKRGTVSLSLDLLDFADIGDPGLRRTEPDLPTWVQLGALFEGADAQPVGLGILGGGGVDRGATIGAERMGAFIAAFGGLDIDLGSPRQQDEGFGRCLDIDPVRGAGQGLAICAMADAHRAWIDLSLERNLTAVALAFDLHGVPPSYVGRPINPSAPVTNTRT